MSRAFLTPIDLNQNELRNARLQNLASAPGSPVAGQTYFDTGLLAQYTWNGAAWVAADASKLSGTIPNTALATNPLARANHTGTQLSGTISDLAATVQAYRLNQFAAPNANVPMAGYKLTGLAAPTTTGDAATWDFVLAQAQSTAAGISSKDPVNAVSTANVATLSGAMTVDGVALTAGNRVLLTAQSTASQNGPWVVSSGAWTRPVTEGSTGELDFGAMWLCLAGTVGAGTQWRVSSPTTGTITPGTTSIAIVQFGAGNSYGAGAGLTLSGSTFAVNPVASGGIVATGAGVSVDTTVVARKFAQTLGDGSTTSFTVTHNLGTQDVMMQVRQTANPFAEVECDMAATSATTSTISFASAPATGAYRVLIVG